MALVSTVHPRVSYADLQQALDDGRRYELYDGEVFVVPAPFRRHQRTAQRIHRLLERYAERHGGEALIAPIDIVFSPYDVVQPDVVYFELTKAQRLKLDAPIREVPTLAVEVLSEGTAANDRGRKLRLLARFRVPEYWIADPTTCTLAIFTLSGKSYHLAQEAAGRDTVRSTALPNLKIPVSRLFPDPPA